MHRFRVVAGTTLALIVVTAPSAGRAEVVESTDAGFNIRHKRDIAAPQSRAWQSLLKPSLWWDPAHTFSGDAANLSLSVPPGGCFCEKLPTRGGAVHLLVIHARPPELLRLSGGLGPLQSHPVTGLMEWRLDAVDGKNTRFTLTYRVRGVAGADWAAPVDGVLAQQVERLQRYLETGKPAPPEGGS